MTWKQNLVFVTLQWVTFGSDAQEVTLGGVALMLMASARGIGEDVGFAVMPDESLMKETVQKSPGTWVGWGFGQPGVVGGGCAHGRAWGWVNFYGPFPNKSF